jgi:hypothetical protein
MGTGSLHFVGVLHPIPLTLTRITSIGTGISTGRAIVTSSATSTAIGNDCGPGYRWATLSNAWAVSTSANGSGICRHSNRRSLRALVCTPLRPTHGNDTKNNTLNANTNTNYRRSEMSAQLPHGSGTASRPTSSRRTSCPHSEGTPRHPCRL